MNGLHRFNGNKFKWLWGYFKILFTCCADLRNNLKKLNKYIYLLYYQLVICWTNTKYFRPIFSQGTLIVIRMV